MQVRALFFGRLKDLTGKSTETLELPDTASVGDVLTHYQSQIPRLNEFMPSLAIAVNQEYAGPKTKLKAGDEVAFLPPVSGGSDAGERPSFASIVHDKINSSRVIGSIKQGDDGALVVFEGIVRNQTHGRKTHYLDYEAYEEMALQQMEDLAARALKEFKIRDIALVHRLGRLEIGETSVLIVVASAHRAAAFDACRWLIDTLKRTVPIWKKEFFEDGAIWADGESFPADIPRANSSV
jgi:molybdopterin converting factor subunit 1